MDKEAALEIRNLMETDGLAATLRLKEVFAPHIGELVMTFGDLEDSIDRELASLLDLDHERAGVMLSQIGDIFPKLSIIKMMVLGQDEKKRTDFKKIETDIRAVNKFRNAVVHGPWRVFYTDTDNIIWQKNWFNRNTHKLEFLDIRLSDIRDMTELCSNFSRRLHDIVRL